MRIVELLEYLDGKGIVLVNKEFVRESLVPCGLSLNSHCYRNGKSHEPGHAISVTVEDGMVMDVLDIPAGEFVRVIDYDVHDTPKDLLCSIRLPESNQMETAVVQHIYPDGSKENIAKEVIRL